MYLQYKKEKERESDGEKETEREREREIEREIERKVKTEKTQNQKKGRNEDHVLLLLEVLRLSLYIPALKYNTIIVHINSTQCI